MAGHPLGVCAYKRKEEPALLGQWLKLPQFMPQFIAYALLGCHSHTKANVKRETYMAPLSWYYSRPSPFTMFLSQPWMEWIELLTELDSL
jgi:hypothetical protein